MKRIVFTERELNALLELICIADAYGTNEGDYMTFDFDAMHTASPKVAELLRRKGSQGGRLADAAGKDKDVS